MHGLSVVVVVVVVVVAIIVVVDVIVFVDVVVFVVVFVIVFVVVVVVVVIVFVDVIVFVLPNFNVEVFHFLEVPMPRRIYDQNSRFHSTKINYYYYYYYYLIDYGLWIYEVWRTNNK